MILSWAQFSGLGSGISQALESRDIIPSFRRNSSRPYDKLLHMQALNIQEPQGGCFLGDEVEQKF